MARGRDIEAIYPLTPMQEGMLFHVLAAREPGVYFRQPAWALPADLEADVLRRAWEEVVRRHSALRTAFVWKGVKQPVQVVRRAVELPWRVEDWSDRPSDEARRAFRQLLVEERRRGLSLTDPPVMRLVLVRLAEEYRLLWSFLQPILDGWSRNLVLDEVLRLYQELRQGGTPSLPRPVPFRDYVAWLARQDLDRAEEFWRLSLRGLRRPTPLPYENGLRPAGFQRETRFDQARIYLDRRTVDALRDLTRTAGLTLATLVQGAWAILLGRTTGSDEVTFGVTVSGRPAELAGVESMVGLFINTLPLRVAVHCETGVGEWLEELQERLAQLQQYGYCPLVRIRDWSDLPGGEPLFRTVSVFENYPRRQAAGAAGAAGGGAHSVSDFLQTNYPVSLVAAAAGERVALLLRFDTECIEPAGARRLLGHLEVLLAGMARDPSTHLADVPHLSPAQHHQVLREWSGAEAPVTGSGEPVPTVLDRFEAWADRCPDRIAVVYEDRRLTYGALRRRAAAVAGALRAAGAGPETVVCLALARSERVVLALLAAWKAGAAYCPLEPGQPSPRVAQLLEDLERPLVLTEAAFGSSLPPVPRERCLDLDAVAGEPCAPGRLARPLPASLAYVLFTSGSSGRPKGVAVEHRQLAHYLRGIEERLDLPEGCSFAMVSPFSTDLGHTALLAALGSGGALHVVSRDRATSPERFAEYMARGRRIDVLKIVPGHLAALMAARRPGEVLPDRRLIVGGEASTWELVERVAAAGGRCRVLNHYGPTETSVGVAVQALHEGRRSGLTVPVGRALRGSRLHPVGPGLRPVAPGAVGELAVAGGGLARGYRRRPAGTAARFVPDPFATRLGGRLYLTGDRMRLQADGRLEFLGRVDDQTKVRGFRVEPGEVEAVLAGAAHVREAAVTVRTAPSGEPTLLAHVVPAAGSRVDPAELRSWLGARLPEPMVPSRIELLGRLPRTATGKVDRRALLTDLRGDGVAGAAVSGGAPADVVEEVLATVWADLLGRSVTGRDADFFALGGNSLVAMRVVARVQQVFGVELPLRCLFEERTLSGVADRLRHELRADRASDAPPLVPAPRDRHLPLSFGQERLWFLDRLDPGGSAYNVPVAFRLSGPFDLRAFAGALRQVLERHEVLRSRFPEVDGRPRQVIEGAAVRAPTVIDLERVPASRGETEVAGIAREEARRPFDLAQGPVFRLSLVRLGPGERVAVACMHHIVSDAWSREIFTREVASLYRAHLERRPSPLPPLALQYADFAAWQRRWLQGEALEAKLDHWRARLAGCPSVLELPTDRPRPATRAFGGASVPVRLAEAEAEALRKLARERGASLFMVLLAAYQLLLARAAGRDDVVVGTPVAGRERAELEGLIGLFINTLPMRGDLSGDPTFGELVERVRDTVLADFAHQDLPFEKLVDELDVERSLAHSPVFQVLLVLQNVPRREMAAGTGLRVTPLGVRNESAKLDLTLFLSEEDGHLVGRLTYDVALFDETTALRLSRGFESLLAVLGSAGSKRLGEVSLLAPGERHQVVWAWNDTSVAYELTQDLLAGFWEQVASRPETVAVEDGGRAVSYRELGRWVAGLAEVLETAGVGYESRVGVWAERSVELVTALLGVVEAGGAYVPLDPEYPRRRLEWMVEDAHVSAVVSSGAPPEWCPPGVRQVAATAGREGGRERRHRAAEGGDRLAYLLYTSGSTGLPKGVMVGHRSIVNRLAWMQEAFGLEPGERVLQKTPFSFDVSVWELFWPLSGGGTLVMARPGRHGDAAYLRSLVAARRVTTVHFVPSMLRGFLSERVEDCVSLRRVIASGEALPYAVEQEWLRRTGCALYNLYGPTEAAVDVTWWPCTRSPSSRPVRIGRPVSNTAVYVVDRDLRAAALGVPGELLLGGVQLARGYRSRPGLTAERFVPDPLDGVQGGRLYRTGDCVRWRPEGELEFLGRLDHQVKVRGHRIELGEVEAALRSHDAVRDVAVVAREGPAGDRLVAYVVPRGAAPPEAKSLRDHLEERVPAYMVPARFERLEELPRTPSGKVDRRALPATSAPAREVPFVPPRGAVEGSLAAIWESVLGLGQVGVEDDFFALGGDSILSIQVVSRARREGLLLTPRDLFLHPTIASLARAVQEVPSAAGADQGAVTGTAPLSPIQRWFFGQELRQPGHFNQSVLLEVREVLDAGALGRVLARLLSHHDALRLRFERRDRRWHQRCVGPDGEVPLTVVDLGRLPSPRRTSTFEAAAADTQRSLDLARGPLLRALYVPEAGGGSGRLLLVVHHLAIDGVSWRILLEDLAGAYRRARRDEPLGLPPKTSSFLAWSRSLVEHTASGAFDPQVDLWAEEAARRFGSLPLAGGPEGDRVGAAETLSSALDAEETETLLRRTSQVLGAGVEELLLAAAARALCSWIGSPAVLVELEGQGREEVVPGVDLARTVGWFTTLRPVTLSGEPSLAPLETLKRVKEELRRVPDRGLGHGALRHLHRDPGVRQRVGPPREPEVRFNYLGQLDRAIPDDAPWKPAPERRGPRMDPAELRARPLEINASMAGSRLRTAWTYGPARIVRSDVEALATAFDRELRRLLAAAEGASATAHTPTDFPLAGLDQAQLDRLFEGDRALEDLYPLSPVQRGMLLHGLERPGSGVYVEQATWTLRGTLDRPAFERAWQALARRHPIFRTAFLWEGVPVPLQRVDRRIRVPIEHLDWSGDGSSSEACAAELLEDDRRRGFDLSTAPLIRVTLIRLDEDRHRVLWTYHHLVSDGWSNPIVVRELTALYRSYSRGAHPRLTPVRPYRDFIAWLAATDRRGAEAFWRSELAGLDAPTPLGMGRIVGEELRRPRSFGDHRVRLAAGAAEDVARLARSCGVTPGLVVQAAWALLLHRYSGEERVVFGATVSGRPAELPGVEAIVGPFINTVPIVVRLPQETPVGEWLLELRERHAERQLHDHASPIQQWSDVPLGLPLFESLLVHQNYPTPASAATPPEGDRGAARDDLELSHGRTAIRTRYPLNLVVRAGTDALDLYFAYDRNRFAGRDIAGAARCLEAILRGLAAAPETALRDVGRQELDDWPEPRAPSEPRIRIRGRTVYAAEVEEVLACHPGVDEVAVAPVRAEGRAPSFVAGVVAAEGGGASWEDLGRYLDERSLVPGLLDAVLTLDRLPVEPSGRIDREALAARAAAARAPYRGAGPPAPGQSIESILGDIWREVLGIADLGRDESFLDLGGNSLLAVRLVARLRESLGVELPLETLFRAPTLAALSPAVESAIGLSQAAAPPPVEPAESRVDTPLSFSQQRLWFLDQLDPGTATYNILTSLRISGDLDAGALRLALDQAVRRHEVLRTTFPVVRGTPVQRVGEPGRLLLPVIDLRRLGDAGAEAESRRLGRRLAAQPFELARRAPFRTCLVQLDRKEHALELAIHHIVSDAWSMALLVREVEAAYRRAMGLDAPALPDLPVQYADYAAWQRRWLQGDVLEEHLAYWRRHLGGELRTLRVPGDRPRPARPSSRGAVRSFRFSARLSERLEQFSREEGVTLFMTLLAAFGVQLSRYTRERDLVVGMTVAGRSRAEVEGLVGCFVNTLPLRIDLDRAATARDLLHQVRQTVLGGLAHQETPLEKVVERLRGGERDEGSPVQVTFGVQNAPREDLELPGVSVRRLPTASERVRFDLTVWVWQTESGLVATWKYRTDLYEEETVARMQRHLETLCSGIVASPEAELDSLAMRSEDERRLVAEKERRSENEKRSRLRSIEPSKIRVSKDAHRRPTDEPLARNPIGGQE